MIFKDKLEYTEELIRCWVDSWGEDKVAVSFSGGKDSTVLLDIARRLYPRIPGVFSNTGLEYSEIVSFVKSKENIKIVRPKKPFHKVIDQYGWPVISKKVARFVSDCQRAGPQNIKTVSLRLTGVTSTGRKCPSQTLSKKWRFMIDAPFKISDRCCEHLKKQPLKNFYKKSGLMPMVGVMKSDSDRRKTMINQHGCNAYDLKYPISYPLANWLEEDIWRYIKDKGLEYCSIYDKGEKRTGCVFCMFGIMYDKERFLRLKKNSPVQYDFIINKLGANEVLDFIGIPY